MFIVGTFTIPVLANDDITTLKYFCAATGMGIKQTGNIVDFITKDAETSSTPTPIMPIVNNDEGIKVLLNGTKLTFDVPPQLINGRTMVPMRKIFEEMGAQVEWDNDTQTVTATKDDIIIIMKINNVVISVKGEEITLDVPPQLVDGRTLVPVRAVVEGLGADVQWDGMTQTVIITKEEQPSVISSPTLTKPARHPEFGAMYGYGDDGIAELQYNSRYIFEQSKLPKMIFEDEKEIIEYINTSNVNKMKEKILSIWGLAAAEVIFNDAMLSGENIDINDHDEFGALVSERRSLFGIGDEHIVDVTLEMLDDNTKAVIVKLLDTNWAMLSTYIGISYNKTKGLKIFTLERSIDIMGNGNVPYMFCFVADGSRGSYHTITNDKQAFIDAVKGVMSSSSTPSVSSDEIAVIDGVKCVLDATVYIMDFGSGNGESGDGLIPTTAIVSIYNEKGENITPTLSFGKITLTNGSETILGDLKVDVDDRAYEFVSSWKAGDSVSVSVDVKDKAGKIVKMSTSIKVKTAVDRLQDLLGPGVKIEIN